MSDNILLERFSYMEIKKPINKGKYLGNRKCHCNCLSYAKNNPKKVKAILGCIQVFYDNSTAAHFVTELNNGDILDPTFGNIATDMYSYLIPIQSYRVEGFTPDRELTNLKKHLFSHLPWWLRLFKSHEGM